MKYHKAVYSEGYPRAYYCYGWPEENPSAGNVIAYITHYFDMSPFQDPEYGFSLGAELVFRLLIEFYGASPIDRKLSGRDQLPEYIGEDALCVEQISEWCNGVEPLIHDHGTYDRPGLKRLLYRMGIYFNECYALGRKVDWTFIRREIKGIKKEKYPVLRNYKELVYLDIETHESSNTSEMYGVFEEYVIRKAEESEYFSIFAKPRVIYSNPRYSDPEIKEGYKYIYSCESVDLARNEILYFEESISARLNALHSKRSDRLQDTAIV